jgi:hypothetical protein
MDSPKAPPTKKSVEGVTKTAPPSMPKIELEPNTYKILSEKGSDTSSVFLRLGDGEYAKGVRVFEGFLSVETSERKLRIDLSPLAGVKAVGKCTMWMPYMSIQLQMN